MTKGHRQILLKRTHTHNTYMYEWDAKSRLTKQERQTTNVKFFREKKSYRKKSEKGDAKRCGQKSTNKQNNNNNIHHLCSFDEMRVLLKEQGDIERERKNGMPALCVCVCISECTTHRLHLEK